MKKLDIKYVGVATADDGRNGHVWTDDRRLETVVVPPPSVWYKLQRMRLGTDELDNSAGTNPEQLFAAAYSCDFHGALGAVANFAKVDITGSTVTAKIGVGKDGQGGMGLEVELCVSIPGMDRAVAEKVVEAAHEICPYSQATRGNIQVDLTVL